MDAAIDFTSSDLRRLIVNAKSKDFRFGSGVSGRLVRVDLAACPAVSGGLSHVLMVPCKFFMIKGMSIDRNDNKDVCLRCSTPPKAYPGNPRIPASPAGAYGNLPGGAASPGNMAGRYAGGPSRF